MCQSLDERGADESVRPGDGDVHRRSPYGGAVVPVVGEPGLAVVDVGLGPVVVVGFEVVVVSFGLTLPSQFTPSFGWYLA